MYVNFLPVACPELDVRKRKLRETFLFMADTPPFDLQVRPGQVSGSTVISPSGPLVMGNLFQSRMPGMPINRRS
jgi:hypothetical protein